MPLIYTSVGSLYQKVKDLLIDSSPCAGKKNLNDVIEKLSKLEIGDDAKSPPENFPELTGPSFKDGSTYMFHFLNYQILKSNEDPVSMAYDDYSDGARLYQNIRRMNYENYTPQTIDKLMQNLSMNQAKWLNQAVRSQKSVVAALEPWETEPAPRAVIRPNGQMVVIFGLILRGEGGFKRATSAVTIDLSRKKGGRDVNETIVLTPKNDEGFEDQDYLEEIELTRSLALELKKAKVKGQDTNGIMEAEVVDLTSLPCDGGQASYALLQERMDFDLRKLNETKKDPSAFDSEAQYLRILKTAVQGVVNLHRLGYVHGDIKGENIFVKYVPGKGYEGKIGDFGGISHVASTGRGPTTSTHVFSPPEIYNSDVMSKEYQNPKSGKNFAFLTDHYQKHDVYSLGVEMLKKTRGKDFVPCHNCYSWKNRLDKDGRQMYDQDNKAIFDRHYDLEKGLKWYSEFSDAIEASYEKPLETCFELIAVRAMYPDPELRPTSAEFQFCLDQVVLPKKK